MMYKINPVKTQNWELKINKMLELNEKIKKAREVLWEYDIDPYVGLENLCWAPNVTEQHSDEHIRIIADELISFYNENAPREKILEYLEKMKEVARNLWKNYK